MPDLDLAVSIIDGDLSDLALTRAAGYRIARKGLGPGARLWQRQVAESIFVTGRVLVGRKLSMQTGVLHVRVSGSTTAQLETRIATLLARMEQPEYTLEVVVDGVTFQWRCECADSAPGDAGLFDEFDLMAHQQVIRFTFPRHPTPLDGPL